MDESQPCWNAQKRGYFFNFLSRPTGKIADGRVLTDLLQVVSPTFSLYCELCLNEGTNLRAGKRLEMCVNTAKEK